jgi:hypothetical protein
MFFTSCKKEMTQEQTVAKIKADLIAENQDQDQVTLVSSTNLTDEQLKNQLFANFSSISRLKSLDSTVLDSVRIATYSDDKLKGLVLPLSKNLSYATFTDGQSVSDDGVFIEIKEKRGAQIVNYSDVNGQYIGSVTVQNGNVTGTVVSSEYKGKPIHLNLDKPRESFGKCMERTLTWMSSSSGWPMGVACMFVGPECAIAMMYSCANRNYN